MRMVKSVEATRSTRSRKDCITSLDPTRGPVSAWSEARVEETSGGPPIAGHDERRKRRRAFEELTRPLVRPLAAAKGHLDNGLPASSTPRRRKRHVVASDHWVAQPDAVVLHHLHVSRLCEPCEARAQFREQVDAGANVRERGRHLPDKRMKSRPAVGATRPAMQGNEGRRFHG